MATPRLSRSQRDREFGKPGKVSLKLVQTPWGIRTQCHSLIADRFLLACHLAAATDWAPRRIDGYNHRPIRGSLAPSLHGYGLAWDFFSTPPGVNPPGGVWWPDDTITLRFAQPFLQLGFTWGATFSGRKDAPHLEFAISAEHAPVRWSAL